MNLHVWGKFNTNMNDRVEESQNIRFFRNIPFQWLTIDIYRLILGHP